MKVEYYWANNQHTVTLVGLAAGGTAVDNATVEARIFGRDNLEMAGPYPMAAAGGGTGNYSAVIDANDLDAFLERNPMPVEIRVDVNDGEGEFVLNAIFGKRYV